MRDPLNSSMNEAIFRASALRRVRQLCGSGRDTTTSMKAWELRLVQRGIVGASGPMPSADTIDGATSRADNFDGIWATTGAGTGDLPPLAHGLLDDSFVNVYVQLW